MQLNENSLYTTPQEREDLLKNKHAVMDALIFNYFGFISLFSVSPRKEVKAWKNKQEKVRLNAIEDDNTDVSLTIKLAFDAKLITQSTANELTKLLALFKQGKIQKAKDIDDDKIHELFMKCRFNSSCKPSPELLDVVSSYADREINIAFLGRELYRKSKLPKLKTISLEFVEFFKNGGYMTAYSGLERGQYKLDMGVPQKFIKQITPSTIIHTVTKVVDINGETKLTVNKTVNGVVTSSTPTINKDATVDDNINDVSTASDVIDLANKVNSDTLDVNVPHDHITDTDKSQITKVVESKYNTLDDDNIYPDINTDTSALIPSVMRGVENTSLNISIFDTSGDFANNYTNYCKDFYSFVEGYIKFASPFLIKRTLRVDPMLLVANFAINLINLCKDNNVDYSFVSEIYKSTPTDVFANKYTSALYAINGVIMFNNGNPVQNFFELMGVTGLSNYKYKRSNYKALLDTDGVDKEFIHNILSKFGFKLGFKDSIYKYLSSTELDNTTIFHNTQYFVNFLNLINNTNYDFYADTDYKYFPDIVSRLLKLTNTQSHDVISVDVENKKLSITYKHVKTTKVDYTFIDYYNMCFVKSDDIDFVENLIGRDTIFNIQVRDIKQFPLIDRLQENSPFIRDLSGLFRDVYIDNSFDEVDGFSGFYKLYKLFSGGKFGNGYDTIYASKFYQTDGVENVGSIQFLYDMTFGVGRIRTSLLNAGDEYISFFTDNLYKLDDYKDEYNSIRNNLLDYMVFGYVYDEKITTNSDLHELTRKAKYAIPNILKSRPAIFIANIDRFMSLFGGDISGLLSRDDVHHYADEITSIYKLLIDSGMFNTDQVKKLTTNLYKLVKVMNVSNMWHRKSLFPKLDTELFRELYSDSESSDTYKSDLVTLLIKTNGDLEVYDVLTEFGVDLNDYRLVIKSYDLEYLTSLTNFDLAPTYNLNLIQKINLDNIRSDYNITKFSKKDLLKVKPEDIRRIFVLASELNYDEFEKLFDMNDVKGAKIAKYTTVVNKIDNIYKVEKPSDILSIVSVIAATRYPDKMVDSDAYNKIISNDTSESKLNKVIRGMTKLNFTLYDNIKDISVNSDTVKKNIMKMAISKSYDTAIVGVADKIKTIVDPSKSQFEIFTNKTWDDESVIKVAKINEIGLNSLDNSPLFAGDFKDKTKDDLTKLFVGSAMAGCVEADLSSQVMVIDQVIDDIDSLKQETVDINITLNGRHGNVAGIVDKIFNINMDRTKFDEFVEKDKLNKKSSSKGQIRTMYFHGTGSFAINFIAKFGFRDIPMGTPGISTASKMLGDGIYLAENLDKSLSYISDGGFKKAYQKGYIIVVDVCLGEPKVEYLDVNSIGGANSIRSPEWCIKKYDRQILVKKIIQVKSVTTQEMQKFVK